MKNLNKAIGIRFVAIITLLLLNLNVKAVTISGSSNVCVGTSVTFTATPSGGSWTSSNSATATVDATTGYVTGVSTGSVTISYSISGSVVTKSINIRSNPSISAGANVGICIGSSTLLNATGAGDYTWAPATGLSSTRDESITASPTTTTTYTVSATNSYGCTGSATVIVSVNTYPVLSAGGNVAICSGSPSVFTATGATTYTWTPSTGLSTTTGNSVTASPTSSITYTITGSNSGCNSSITKSVTVNASPSITVGSGSTICAGSSTSAITAAGGVSYSWAPASGLSSTNSASVTASPSSTTVYTVTGTSSNGCSKSASVTVSVNALPTISTGVDASVCFGGSTVLNVTGASTYSWAPSTGLSANTGATVTANPSSSITYTITGVSGAGCSNTTTKAVTVNALPIVTSGAGIAICNGSTASISASGASTYSWSPATGLSATTGAIVNANPSSNITYTITGTSAAGCTGTATKSVSVNAIPAVTVGSASAICAGSSTSAITASGAVSYSWAPATGLSSTTASSVIASPGSTTNYTVTGTAANGCTNVANVTVTVNPLPTINAGSSVAICSGASTTLTATGGVSYSWMPSTGLTSTTAATVTANPASTTIYTVTGTASNGCSNKANVTISVNALPTISTGAAASLCIGGSAVLNVTGASTYSWVPGTGLSATSGSSVTSTPSASTTYTVTGTSANGCVATAVKVVSVNPNPVVSAGAGLAICNGASATLTATGADTYSWLPSTGLSATTGASVTANPSSTIAYTVTGTSAAGCVSTSSTVVSVNPAPSISSVGNGGAICAGNTLNLNSTATATAGTINYSWAGPGSFTSTIQNPVISAATTTSTGIYTLTVTDATGCSATATTTTTVNPTPDAGSIAGGNSVCMGNTLSLTNVVSGGIWSSNSSVATIGSTTGILTANGIGSAVISYNVTNGYGCSNVTTNTVSVNGVAKYIYTFAGTGTNATTGDNGPAYLASIQGPRSISTDTFGNLYMCDINANLVRKISVNGIISTVAGNGTAGNTGDGGPATAAQLGLAGGGGLCIDKAGNVYISCTQAHTIRKVNASTGIITTIAGIGTAGFSGDGGAATAAKMYFPLGLCQDTVGNIYFADQSNYRIRKIDATTGIISTVVGTGSAAYSGDGGQGTAARLSLVRDVVADKSGNLYIVDNGNNVIRKYVIGTGIVTTIAGNNTVGASGDGGAATAAQFNCPARIAFDGGSNLYVADQFNNKIRKINLNTGIISTEVAVGTGAYSGDGGPSVASKIWAPSGIAFNKQGNLFIADANNRRIRLAPVFGGISIKAVGSSTVVSGASVSFTATTGNYSGTVTMQWQKNGVNVGTSSNSYTNSTPASGDVYRCILTVTPECGAAISDTSNSITVSVVGARSSNNTTITEELENNVSIKMYPNPMHNQLNIEATNIENGTMTINVMDQMGRVVTAQTTEVSNNQLTQQLDVQSLATGMYIVSMTDSNGKNTVVKCVKN